MRRLVVTCVVLCATVIAAAQPSSSPAPPKTYEIRFKADYNPLAQDGALWRQRNLRLDPGFAPGVGAPAFLVDVGDDDLPSLLTSSGVAFVSSHPRGHQDFAAARCSSARVMPDEYMVYYSDRGHDFNEVATQAHLKITAKGFEPGQFFANIPQQRLAEVFSHSGVRGISGRCLADVRPCAKLASSDFGIVLKVGYSAPRGVEPGGEYRELVRDYGLRPARHGGPTMYAGVSKRLLLRLRRDPRVEELELDCKPIPQGKLVDACSEREQDVYVVTVTSNSDAVIRKLEELYQAQFGGEAIGQHNVFTVRIPKETLSRFVADGRVVRVEAECIGHLK